jgi:hypothetical protein
MNEEPDNELDKKSELIHKHLSEEISYLKKRL